MDRVSCFVLENLFSGIVNDVTTARWESHLNSQRKSQRPLGKIPVTSTYLPAYWCPRAMAVKINSTAKSQRQEFCVFGSAETLTESVYNRTYTYSRRPFGYSVEYCWVSCLFASLKEKQMIIVMYIIPDPNHTSQNFDNPNWVDMAGTQWVLNPDSGGLIF